MECFYEDSDSESLLSEQDSSKSLLKQDCEALLEQAKLQDQELINKRRWLIGLPTLPSENDTEGSFSKFQNEKPIPEYLLREDDVSYETIKSFVEKGVEARDTKTKYHINQDEMQLVCCSPRNVRGLFSLVGNMTNQGLLHFAEALAGGSIKFEKTRWKMKQIINECLSQVFPKNKNIQRINLSEYHSSILKNPLNYHWAIGSRFLPDADSYHTAVHKILHLLEDLPTLTLSAMYRKIKGNKGYTPQFIPKKPVRVRDSMIKGLRKRSLEFLSILHKGHSLQEPLAKAMEVASLTLKLIRGCHFVTSFLEFPHEMKVFQINIAMSIQQLDRLVDLSVLKDIQVLLAPEAELDNWNLRVLIKNFLTEYLLECSGDVDDVPKRLHKVIAIIKKSCEAPYKSLEDIKIEEDVESILSVGASTKQVMWDLLPEHELDLEFTDAYMEDLVDNDDGDFWEDRELEENKSTHFSNLDEEEGSIGDNFNTAGDPSYVVGSSSTKSCSLNQSEVINSLSVHSTGYHLVSLKNTQKQMDADSLKDFDNQEGVPLSTPVVSSNISSLESNLKFDDQSTCENQYLDVQAASDQTSLVAYRLIGLMLNDFAQAEGCELSSSDRSYLGAGGCDNLNPKKRKASRKKGATSNKEDGRPVLVKAVEELLPSFDKCEADKLKELMGLQQ